MSADQVGKEIGIDWQARAESVEKDLEAWKQLCLKQENARDRTEKQLKHAGELIDRFHYRMQKLEEDRVFWRQKARGLEDRLQDIVDVVEPVMKDIKEVQAARALAAQPGKDPEMQD